MSERLAQRALENLEAGLPPRGGPHCNWDQREESVQQRLQQQEMMQALLELPPQEEKKGRDHLVLATTPVLQCPDSATHWVKLTRSKAAWETQFAVKGQEEI